MAAPHSFTYNLGLLLRDCKEKETFYHSTLGAKYAMFIDPKSQPTIGHVHEKPSDFELRNESLSALLSFYGRSSAEEQAEFSTQMLRYLHPFNGGVIAHALVALRDVAAVHRVTKIDYAARSFWATLAQALEVEHGKFTVEDIDHIERAVSNVRVETRSILKPDPPRKLPNELVSEAKQTDSVLKRILISIGKVRTIRLKNELLQRPNPAVDVDRRELLSRLKALAFTPDLALALDEIERKSTAASTPLDFKTGMDLLRSFYEGFFKEAARKAAEKSTVPLPSQPNQPHFAPYKDYLLTVGVIGVEEEELSGKLFRYVSQKGAHTLGSAPEQFGVSKVMVIEWCLMIAGRVKTMR